MVLSTRSKKLNRYFVGYDQQPLPANTDNPNDLANAQRGDTDADAQTPVRQLPAVIAYAVLVIECTMNIVAVNTLKAAIARSFVSIKLL